MTSSKKFAGIIAGAASIILVTAVTAVAAPNLVNGSTPQQDDTSFGTSLVLTCATDLTVDLVVDRDHVVAAQIDHDQQCVGFSATVTLLDGDTAVATCGPLLLTDVNTMDALPCTIATPVATVGSTTVLLDYPSISSDLPDALPEQVAQPGPSDLPHHPDDETADAEPTDGEQTSEHGEAP